MTSEQLTQVNKMRILNGFKPIKGPILTDVQKAKVLVVCVCFVFVCALIAFNLIAC